MTAMAIHSDTTDLQGGMTLMVWCLVTWTHFQKKKLFHVTADIDVSPPAAFAPEGADDKTGDPAKKQKTAAALRAPPPTITDEEEAEAYDLSISAISESVLTRLLKVQRTARDVWVTLRTLYASKPAVTDVMREEDIHVFRYFGRKVEIP